MKSYKIIFLFLTLFGVLACSNDLDSSSRHNPDDPDQVEVFFSINVPSVSTSTRAMSPQDENRLKDIDILMFREESGGEKFAYRAHNTNDLSNSISTTMYVRAMLPTSSSGEKFRMVLVANMREELDNLFEGNDYTGMLKETLLEKITVVHESIWPANNIHGYKPIPMWGEARNLTEINKNTTPDSFGGNISMLRALARVQVAVNLTNHDGLANGTDFFDLSEIKVYNERKEGQLVPDRLVYSNGKVSKPTLSTNGDVLSASAMTYVLNDLNPFHNNSLENSIYLNEAVNKDAEKEDALYLIIKGFYTEPGAAVKNTTKATYYRVDFYERDSTNASQNRIDILRNHSYKVNINYIGGPGEETEEDAKQTIPVQMKADIYVWSEGDTQDVVWNGQYMLGVSQSLFEVSNNAQLLTLKVTTNHRQSWYASTTDSWISFDRNTTWTGPNQQDEFSFKLTENPAIDDREGYIHFTVDNLTLPVKIIQHDKGDISIDILSSSGAHVDYLEFTGPNLTQNAALRMIWSPAEYDCHVNEIHIQGPAFTYKNGVASYPQAGKNTGGVKYYSVAPTNFTDEQLEQDPFVERIVIYTFTVGDLSHIETKTLTVKQSSLNLVANPKEYYTLDAGTQSFQVRSNTSWTLQVLNNDDGLIDESSVFPRMGGYNRMEGEQVSFAINPNASSSNPEMTATLRFNYLVNIGPWAYGTQSMTKDYTIRVENNLTDVYRPGISSNCYIIHPEGQGVQIPVIRANMDGNIRINDGDQLEPVFLWTDNKNGVKANSAVSEYKINGSGPSAVLEVLPGSQSGNAVIGVKNLTTGGNMIWSWHIWVTEFDPDQYSEDRYQFRTYQFLDRNLGALNDTPGNQGFVGLYYQWGRKDPYPTIDGWNSTTPVKIYNELGNEVSITKQNPPITWQSSGNNLEHSIQNPMIFYTGSENWHGPETGGSTQYFWNKNDDDMTKDIYDPCPEGWSVPVGSQHANSPWYSLFSTVSYNSSTNTTRVRSSEVDLGYWPVTGYINYQNGNYSNGDAYYWTSTQVQGSHRMAMAIRIPKSTNAVNISESFAKSQGCHVRCMRRDPTAL